MQPLDVLQPADDAVVGDRPVLGARSIVLGGTTFTRPFCSSSHGAPVKTDGLDAGSLALKYEQGSLKAIYIPSRER